MHSSIQQILNDNDAKDILIFDYNGAYKQFDNNNTVESIEIEDLPFNPLSLHGKQELFPLLTGNRFKFTMAKYAHLDPQQQGALLNATKKAYEEKGITYEDPNSWKNIAPTIKDVVVYIDEINNTQIYNTLNNLITLNVGSTVTKTSLLDFISGVKIIDLSDIQSDIQDLIVALFLDALYLELCAITPSNKNRKFIQIEERENLKSYSHQSLIKLLDEGKKWEVTILL